MLRSEVMLSEELKLLLDSLAFIKSRKTKKELRALPSSGSASSTGGITEESRNFQTARWSC